MPVKTVYVEVELKLRIDDEINNEEEINHIIKENKLFIDMSSSRGFSLYTSGNQKLIRIKE